MWGNLYTLGHRKCQSEAFCVSRKERHRSRTDLGFSLRRRENWVVFPAATNKSSLKKRLKDVL